jgi:hypothetical protein
MPTDADRTADYKGFTIRTFKTPNGSWRAIITKVDGTKIKAADQNESFDLIPVQLDSLDRDKALKEAKRLIDAGGMSVSRERTWTEAAFSVCVGRDMAGVRASPL